MNLHNLRNKTHGVSVIVGALMLTLIVVAAAGSFAIFTGQKQAELQAQQLENQRRSQENIGIFAVDDLHYGSDDDLEEISVNIGSLHTRESEIRRVLLNGERIDYLEIERQNKTRELWWMNESAGFYELARIIGPYGDTLYDVTWYENNWKYDSSSTVESNGVIDFNESEPANPVQNNSGYLVGLDSNDGFFLFKDSYRKNWKLDEEELHTVNSTPNLFDETSNSEDNFTVHDPGYLVGLNSTGKKFLFQDSKKVDYTFNDDILYDESDTCFYNKSSNSFNGTPENINKGYLVANDSSTPVQYFLYQDNSTNDASESITWKERLLTINPNEQISVFIDRMDYREKINVSNEGIQTKFSYSEEIEEGESPVTIHFLTGYVNTFNRTFLPPTPNIKVEIKEDTVVLDGSDSFCENDATIIEWKWNLTNKELLVGDSGRYLPEKVGRIVNANRILTDDATVTNLSTSSVDWLINLTVRNNYGMIGTTSLEYEYDFRDIMAEKEDLEITAINPQYNEISKKVKNLTLVIKSNYEYDANITQIWFNNQRNLSIDTNNPITVLDFSENDSIPLFNLDDEISFTTPITIKFKTELGNTFEETFYPPNAILRIQQEILPGATDTIYILDGSLSEDTQSGYIVKWEWNVTNITAGIDYQLVGKKVQYDDFYSPYEYWVNLTVFDNRNLRGFVSYKYDLS